MALVDADYKFLWIDVGSDGSSNDASIYNGLELKEGDFINDDGDGVWINSEVVGQAWIIVTAGQVS
jgi:hypothetical protein